MLIPCGDSVELRTPPGSIYCSMQLSPDGKVYAIATTKFIQIWSAGPETILLSQRELRRASNLAEDVLKRIFIVWNGDSSQFAVVCGEGVIVLFTITYLESLFSLDSGLQRLAYVPSCDLQAGSVYNIEEYGFPLCVSTMESSIILGTDTGNTIFIGDQLFTDVYGAKRSGIRNILVKPIHPKEEIQIVLKRYLEKIVLHFYKKEEGIS